MELALLDDMTLLDQKLHASILDKLASSVGTSWKQLARHLGFTDVEIQHLEYDNRHNLLREVIYQCLLEWMQKNPNNCMVTTLASGLKKCNETEALNQLLLFVKNDYRI